MSKETRMIIKELTTKIIHSSYFERTFGVSDSKRIVRLDDVIKYINFYCSDLDFYITDKEVEEELQKYFAELKGENNG